MELPELPRTHEVIDGLWEDVFGPYDADQMRAYGKACVNAALYAAEKVFLSIEGPDCPNLRPHDIASAIRALKGDT